jgi:very-short-patch-repair endonuclease
MNRRQILPYNPKLLPLARELRKNMTMSEILLWQELKGKQLLGYDFDRQIPIDNYIVDFYCKKLNLVIEIDGSSHTIDVAPMKDEIRQRRLENLGLQFLRFDDLDVKQNMKFVLNEIHHWIMDNTHP